MPLDELIPGVIGLSLLTGVALYFSRLAWWGRASKSWPVAAGTIVSSTVVHSKNNRNGPSAWLRVQYTFVVEGRTITGKRRFFGDFIDANAGVAASEAGRYPTGAAVKVRYHPRTPGLCTLESRVDVRVWLAAVFGVVMALVIARALLVGE